LPFGTVLRVSDACNEHGVLVVVNDRGPFVAGRVLDLSLAAGKALAMLDRGIVWVTAIVERLRAIRLRDLFSKWPARATFACAALRYNGGLFSR